MLKCQIRGFVLTVAIAIFFLSGCGGTMSGQLGNTMNTTVQLGEANFVVIKTVEGSASARQVLGFNVTRRDLYQRAKREMLNSAQLTGKPRALVNVTVDVNTSYFLIVQSRTVLLSAEVIEFVE